jgi:hypothetical protein
MKSSADIEQLLERFGSDWPGDDSIADRVMRQIEAAPPRLPVSKGRRIMVKSLLAIAASAAACVALWWVFQDNHNSLYAQVIDAARKARTIHITHYGQLGGEAAPTKSAETWYESRVGFRRDVCHGKHEGGRCVTVCLGRGDDTWTLDKERQDTIIHSHSGITKETEEIFAAFGGLKCDVQRYPEGDRAFDGQPCKAYLPKMPGVSDLSLKNAKWRELFYLDQRSRVVRVVRQERDGDRWNTTAFSTIAYDEPFDPALFQPNFGADFKIVDADAKPVDPEPAKPARLVLIYEIDRSSKPAGTATVDMDRLLRVVDVRLNGGTERLAAVRKLDDRRIEVTLLRRGHAARQRVERQLARPGTLEFRVLANNQTDKALVDRARKDPAAGDVLDPSGRRLAWWVPVRAGEQKGLAGRNDITQRTRKRDNRDVTEILVVADPYDVTGACLTRAKLEFDPLGNPTVRFAFSDAGGELFGKLTGDHLPKGPTGPFFKLGIIIDGELFSAPMIRSKIGKAGEISGRFTEIEASDLAAVLNAGSLPVRLRLVEGDPLSTIR